MMNVGYLFFLIIYVYSIIGVNLFSDVILEKVEHQNLNFQTFFNSFTTLFVATTGEAWDELMNELG